MSWVYVDDHLSKDMPGTCTCIHLHAPASTQDREGGDKREGAKKEAKKHLLLSPKSLVPKTYIYKTLRLQDLPSDPVWWAARAAEHPGVDLHKELDRALDWPGAPRVKNAKLFFRNWLDKAVPATPDLTADERRAQLGVVS